jgi:hypothetical protein
MKNGIKRGNLLFSIGDVYFKRICKLNTYYSEKFIEQLMNLVVPERNDVVTKVKKFFRK